MIKSGPILSPIYGRLENNSSVEYHSGCTLESNSSVENNSGGTLENEQGLLILGNCGGGRNKLKGIGGEVNVTST